MSNAQQVLTLLYKKGLLLSVDDGDLLIDNPDAGLNADDITLIKQHKSALIALIESLDRDAKDLTDNLRPVKQPKYLPGEYQTSPAQQRMLFMENLACDEQGSQSYYNLPMAWQITGALNQGALTDAFYWLVNQHDVLRTSYRFKAGEYVQWLDGDITTSHTSHVSPEQLIITNHDISGEPDPQVVLKQLLADEANHRFDLINQWPIKLAVIKLAGDRVVVSINIHHIAVDGWSARHIIGDISRAYQAFDRHSTVQTTTQTTVQTTMQTDPSLQYIDYVAWQQRWLQSEHCQQAKAYWLKQLQGLPQLHSLPTDFSRPDVRSVAGGHYQHKLPNRLVEQLHQLAGTFNTSAFVIVQSVFAALLNRYSRQNDIVFGTAAANREPVEFADTVGLFVNTLVLRYQVDGEQSLTDWVGQAKIVNSAAKIHQQYPFDLLVEALQPERHPGFNPLVQIMLVMQDGTADQLPLEGLQVTRINQHQPVAKLDLTLDITFDEGTVLCDWEYASTLFSPQSIGRLASHFVNLMQAAFASPHKPLQQLTMQNPVQLHQMLVEWNDTRVDYPAQLSIHQLFEQQVKQTPEAVALSCDGQTLSYQALDKQANQLAVYLQTQGVGVEVPVGLCLERSIEMMVALLAILKAGGVYVPLDANYPPARLAYIIDDAQMKHLISRKEMFAPEVSLDSINLICPEGFASFSDNHLVSVGGDNLAYIIYTSGSTGQPKGVMVEHHSLVNAIVDFMPRYGLDNNSRMLQFVSPSFDVSLSEIFMTLCAGGCLVLVDKEALLPGEHLAQTLRDEGITHVISSASALSQVTADNFPALKTLIVGGEVSSAQMLANWTPLCDYFLAYGPTEATIISTTRQVQPGVPNRSIGYPLANTRCYVLDDGLQPVPVGVSGELYIAGAGVARGYLNREALTAERFIDITLPGGQKERVYQTGDLVRWLVDGQTAQLEFLGRVDSQVKVRGFRIEPGEIESILLAHTAVSHAIVLAKDEQLNTYIVSEDSLQQERLIDQLRQAISQCLPDYMLPGAFVFLPELPLTANGKVDIRALPDPDMTLQQVAYIQPTTDTQKVLCDIWQQVLGVKQVGITDNFFKLGGHSLSATRMMTQVAEQLGISVPLKTLFSHQTIVALAAQLTNLAPGLARPPLTTVSRDIAGASNDDAGELLTSFAQQRLWLLDKIDGTSVHYNMPAALTLSGELNIAALQQAFSTIVARHESLRTVFTPRADGQPMQRILPALPVDIALTDLSVSLNQASELAKASQQHAEHRFDLAADIMLHLALIKLGNSEHVLLFNLHHIASDGWSMGLLINEFSLLYRAYVQGESNPLPALTVQYADYAHWQRNWLQGDVLAQHLSYWQQQLAGLPTVHQLPLDKPRPALQTFNGATVYSQLDITTTGQLQQLTNSAGASLFMGLQAAFAVLLARYSNQSDIVMGSPVANREQAEVAGLIGFFVNTLVLRSDLSGDPSFADLLNQSKQMLLGAYDHQQVPFEPLVDALQPQRSLSHTPLFQVMLSLQNNQTATLELPGLAVTVADKLSKVAKFDLSLDIQPVEQGLTLCWEYNTDLFNPQTIEQMAEHFSQLVQTFVRAPDSNVLSVSMLNDNEQQLLEQWGRATPVPESISTLAQTDNLYLHQAFERQAQQNPQAIAVVMTGQQLSYGELNRQANQLAHYLLEQPLKPNALVGICIERSPQMLVAIMAVLKAGMAYVPVDPAYPQARQQHMIEDAGLTVLLTQDSLLAQLPLQQQTALCLDPSLFESQFGHCSVDDPLPVQLGLAPDHLAYVIYTSGSTGLPKGVMVSHRAIAVHNQGVIKRLLMTSDDRVFQFASMSFDVFVEQVFTTLSVGAQLHLRDQTLWGVEQFFAYCHQQQITLTDLPPLYLGDLLASAAAASFWQQTSLSRVLVGGDVLPLGVVQQWQKLTRADAKLFNSYGPTETVVTATMAEINHQTDRVCIGKPLPGRCLYVVDKHQQLVPQGVPGELLIGGDCLASGYLHQPALTAERFIADLQSIDFKSTARLYKTGDLVRWLPDGQLDFLGRIDQQVKIRGFRIELGEIEHQLRALVNIDDAVVVTHAHEASLVAYLKISRTPADEAVFIGDVRQSLGELIPDYMVPSFFVLLDAFPLLPSGKLDKNALPIPTKQSTQAQTFIAPGNETEQKIARLWANVLGLDSVSVVDNFYDIGGNSLKLVSLASRLSTELNVPVTPLMLLQTATVRKLATHLAGQTKTTQPVKRLSQDKRKALLQTRRRNKK